jgi:hypothetical protein
MATIAAFAVIVFLLGMYFGLPYQQAYKRRLALMEQDKNELTNKKNHRQSLDKPSSPG